ncbi:uncharacterized protein [Littorina saxatilis]|uniref:Uncharacterized protein n=1 Tax=Littorina saxatilis TaxID=31220 RepID=A0AAN9BME2_9CAEN
MVAAMLFYRYQRALCVVIVAVLWPWREGPALFADGQVQCQAKTDVCGCVFDDGSGTIDVSSLANTDGTPRFQTVPGGPHNETYYYNPCTPFNKVTCSEAAVCVVNANGENATQVGDAETATWIYQAQGQGGVNASVLIANYQHRGSDFISQSFVKFVCDPSASTPTFELENDDNNVYLAGDLLEVCYPVATQFLHGCWRFATRLPPSFYTVAGGLLPSATQLLPGCWRRATLLLETCYTFAGDGLHSCCSFAVRLLFYGCCWCCCDFHLYAPLRFIQ